jgi:hypothetical protein
MPISILGGVIRHFLGLAAGALVTKGYLDADTAQTAVGAVGALVTIGWSAWEKRSR